MRCCSERRPHSNSMTPNEVTRRLSIGAEVLSSGGVHFRVWAPRRRNVAVVIEEHETTHEFSLEPETAGYFSGVVDQASDGTLYRFRLDGGETLFPDPASRFQPRGPHGPSRVVDPGKFTWSDDGWQGRSINGQVIYETHIGTFTPEGTWASAIAQLPELMRIGITVIEVMPVADFPGRFGWGYDGVNLFAPTRLYGEPDDFRRFIDRAHSLGMAVILDVVYNHLGPDGNYLREFSGSYFSSLHKTEWGEAINYDSADCASVREYYLDNVIHWINEYHLDGLRLDATHAIVDDSKVHILSEIVRTVHQAAKGRATIVVAENESQQVKLVQSPAVGGYGLDALWNDDFHHSAMVAMTGRNEAYYTDYHGKPQEFISAAKYGFLYQGQWYRWQYRRRGTGDRSLPASAFVTFIQNHDQIANSGRGERCHALTSPGRYRAMTALLLLLPGTPMLFQGQEFAASGPFCFFADFDGDLKRLVRDGRIASLLQFRSLATEEGRASLPDPGDPQTFERCKLDFSERERHAGVYLMHSDLIRLRHTDPAFSEENRADLDGAVLSEHAFVLRFFGHSGKLLDDRLLVVNLGTDLVLNPAPEPLLGPPLDMQWGILWSSEDPHYGGTGTPPLETTENWIVPGQAAVVLRPVKRGKMPKIDLIHPDVKAKLDMENEEGYERLATQPDLAGQTRS
jgi:maltooligosyltrehalose trehalohydrolase